MSGSGPRGGARVSLPPIHRSVLPGGTTLLIVERHELPTVAVHLAVRAGSGDNPLSRAGLADMTADMLPLGAEGWSADRIAEQVDSLGATLNTAAGWDATSLSAMALAEDFETILALLAALVRTPSFPADELEQLRQRRLNLLATRLDTPSVVAGERFAAALYPGHPYGLPQDGTPEAIRALSREDLEGFHSRYYVPDRTVLIVAGDVEPGRAEASAREAFSGWKPAGAAGAPAQSDPPPPGPKGLRVVLVDRPDLTQSQIRIGHPGIPRDDADWFPLQVANYILGGGGFSSRLMDRIRVQKGLTYGLSGSFSARRSRGPYMVSTFTPNESVGEVVRECLEVTRRFRAEGPSSRELEDARGYFVSSYPRNFETPSGVASALIEVEVYGLGDRHIETYQERFAAVDLEEVRRVAAERFEVEDLLVLVVGRAAQVREQLSALSEVEEVSLAREGEG